MTIIADGGADFNVNHITNECLYMKLFRDLDVIIATTHCPGFYARNLIEHVWSVLTKASTSIYLPDHLPDETSPAQHKLSPAEKEANEVFDAALQLLDKYWSNLHYGGVKIKVSHRTSSHEPSPL